MFPLTSVSTLQEVRSGITQLNFTLLRGEPSPPGCKKPEKGIPSSGEDLAAVSRYLKRVTGGMDTEPFPR